jgi:predicted DNA-binding protein with PD1-like motif
LSIVLVQVNRGQEVIDTITREAAKRRIATASISLIGAVQQVTVSVMKKDQPKVDYLREYDQPFELTGTGEITTDGVHVHVTLAGEDLIVAGHLHSATVQDFFVRAYITPLTD